MWMYELHYRRLLFFEQIWPYHTHQGITLRSRKNIENNYKNHPPLYTYVRTISIGYSRHDKTKKEKKAII